MGKEIYKDENSPVKGLKWALFEVIPPVPNIAEIRASLGCGPGRIVTRYLMTPYPVIGPLCSCRQTKGYTQLRSPIR